MTATFALERAGVDWGEEEGKGKGKGKGGYAGQGDEGAGARKWNAGTMERKTPTGSLRLAPVNQIPPEPEGGQRRKLDDEKVGIRFLEDSSKG